MDWINDLLWGEGIGHSILLLFRDCRHQLGKIKVFGISWDYLGVVGIILGHFGFTVNHNGFISLGIWIDLICLFGRYASRAGFLLVVCRGSR